MCATPCLYVYFTRCIIIIMHKKTKNSLQEREMNNYDMMWIRLLFCYSQPNGLFQYGYPSEFNTRSLISRLFDASAWWWWWWYFCCILYGLFFFLSSVFKFECSGLLTLDSKYMNIGITMEMLMEQVKYDIKMLVPMYAFSACVLSTWKK